MTEISLDRDGAELILKKLEETASAIDGPLQALPAMPDGGLASSLIALITRTGAEAAGVVASSYHAFHAVATDVLDDMSLTEQDIAEELREFEAGF